jgi:hypothetical protein
VGFIVRLIKSFRKIYRISDARPVRSVGGPGASRAKNAQVYSSILMKLHTEK